MTTTFSDAANSAAQLLVGTDARSFLYLIENLFEEQFDHVEEMVLKENDEASVTSTFNLIQLRSIREHLYKLKYQSQND